LRWHNTAFTLADSETAKKALISDHPFYTIVGVVLLLLIVVDKTNRF